jgi:hypothetical protein
MKRNIIMFLVIQFYFYSIIAITRYAIITLLIVICVMFKMSPEYNYGLTTNYNEENIYPNGSAIFIHCKGQKPFTGGCIALDEEYMEMILKSAEEGMHIYLDEYYSKE